MTAASWLARGPPGGDAWRSAALRDSNTARSPSDRALATSSLNALLRGRAGFIKFAPVFGRQSASVRSGYVSANWSAIGPPADDPTMIALSTSRWSSSARASSARSTSVKCASLNSDWPALRRS